MKSTLILVFLIVCACWLSGCNPQPSPTASASPSPCPSPPQPAGARPASGEDYKGQFTEEKEICGAVEKTPELHNATCRSSGPGCECIADGKWCFKRTHLSVSTPNSKWVFSGSPRVDCAQDNDGSCGWNALGAPDRFFVTQNNPTEIKADVLTSSRSIGVRVCAQARYYP